MGFVMIRKAWTLSWSARAWLPINSGCASDMAHEPRGSLDSFWGCHTASYQIGTNLFKYGDDKFTDCSGKIEQARSIAFIETSRNCIELPSQPFGGASEERHPATDFSGHSIESMMNWERRMTIQQAIDLLAVDGRFGVITFIRWKDRLASSSFSRRRH